MQSTASTCRPTASTCRLSRLGLGILGVLLTAPAVAADFSFTDVTTASGLDPNHAPLLGMATGAAAADADADGDIDLFIPQAASSRLYENQGDGSFVESATAAGLGGISSRAGLWFDADGDGDLDLLTARDSTAGPVFRLFRNDGTLAFTEITATAGDPRDGGR